jgi:hypothetical protein
LQDAAVRAGARFLSEERTLTNCVAIVGRDLGMDDPVGYVPVVQRRRLLERFPDLLDDDVSDRRGTVARCTVCCHGQRDEIESAIATGMSYRDAAATFGVSRSALSRHMGHLR